MQLISLWSSAAVFVAKASSIHWTVVYMYIHTNVCSYTHLYVFVCIYTHIYNSHARGVVVFVSQRKKRTQFLAQRIPANAKHVQKTLPYWGFVGEKGTEYVGIVWGIYPCIPF